MSILPSIRFRFNYRLVKTLLSLHESVDKIKDKRNRLTVKLIKFVGKFSTKIKRF